MNHTTIVNDKMLSESEILNGRFLFKLLGYSLSIVGANLVYRCSFELFNEYKNITLRSWRMFGVVRSLLLQKFENKLQILYIFAAVLVLFISPEFRETISKHSDFLMVFLVTMLILIVSSVSIDHQSEDPYKYFICNSGLDCGSFMAYSFYHGYIKYVVASNGEPSSKGLVERIDDYETKHGVHFPIKKLLILQPQSMYIPPTLKTKLLQNADNLEEVKINIGGVVNRSYQLSVYKIEGVDWYVNVQGASPLLTYSEESKRSKLLDKYKNDVAHSFRKHLDKLIWNDLRCRGLVEVVYYNDLDENGQRVDVGLVLRKHIEDTRNNSSLSGI